MERTRADIINRIFEHAEAMKRGMYGHMQAYFRNLPVQRAPLEVLSAVKHLQPVSSKEIARQLYLTPGAVSQSVESLNQHGYLVREADQADRRIQYLRLSKKGEKLLTDIGRHRREMMEQVMRDLTFEELTVWLKVQTKMAEQFQAAHQKGQSTDTKTKKEVR